MNKGDMMRLSLLFRPLPAVLVVAGWMLLAGVVNRTYATTHRLAESAQKTAIAWIDRNADEVVEWSDSIWRFAEPPFEEFQTVTLLSDALREAGFSVESHVANMPTAFVATFTHGSGKPVIGIVAEYDTPRTLGQSQKGAVPYEEELIPGHYGHACGHNMIGAGSAASAIAIKDAMVEAGLSGTIKFFGTPAEEELTGKVYMVDAGVFDGLDVALAWHPGPNFEARYGVNDAMRRAKFEFTADSPTKALQAALALRDIAKGDGNPSVLVSGNTAYAEITTAGASVSAAKEKMNALRHEAARIASQADAKVEDFLVIGTHPRIPNQRLVQLLNDVMAQFAPLQYSQEERELARKIATTFDEPPPEEQLMPQFLAPSKRKGGWNDNGDVSWVVPFISVRGGTYVNGITQHTWQQTSLAASSIGHRGLVAMSKVLAVAALELMTSPALLVEVQKEFENRTNGKTYEAVLPEDRNWRWVRK